MSDPLNVPIVPGNLAQRRAGLYQRMPFSFSVPITDDAGVPYAKPDIADVRLGLVDRKGSFGPQLRLGSGIAVDVSGTDTMATVTLNADDMDIAPGEWNFLVAFLVADTWLPLCGGVFVISRNPISGLV